MSDIEPILAHLLDYDEVRLLFGLSVLVIYVVIAALILLIVLHSLYGFTRDMPLYRRRPPVDGWNRRFYPAAVMLLMLLACMAWLASRLSRGESIMS